MPMLEGKPAPAFSLLGSDGKTHHLEDYQGKTLIIFFYPRDDTPGCTKEACGFRDIKPELDQLNTQIIGISRDNMPSHDAFIAKFGLPYVLLSDPDLGVIQSYGAWGEKKLYGKISVGCLRSTLIINPDGLVIKQWPKVKNAADHPQDVLNFLKG